jgi:predicted acylesterase/phospholipase RssA
MADQPFRIALNTAGAVSAGAYTAGVLDFLVEALDAWYEARESGQRADIPKHDVVLEALKGASAGGMCAAISAVALQEEFDHVRNSDPGEKSNRFYKNWVQAIDILPLLGTKDLDRDPIARSVLDCTPIERSRAPL